MTVCIADSVRSERVTPHTYMRAIHNGQATTQLGFGEFFKEPAEREPGHLDGRRPYPPPHHPIVMPDGEGALIGEVLIEGDNQGVRGLRPLVHLAVTLAGQTHLDRVPDPPARLLLQQPQIARGIFWSSRTPNGSSPRSPASSLLCGGLGSSGAKGDDLLLVHDGAGVVRRRDDVLARELRVGVQDLLHGVATRQHAQDVLHHDPGAADARLAATDLRVNHDALLDGSHCCLPCLVSLPSPSCWRRSALEAGMVAVA